MAVSWRPLLEIFHSSDGASDVHFSTRFVQTSTCRDSVLAEQWVKESAFVVHFVTASLATSTVVLESGAPWRVVGGAVLSRYTMRAVPFEE